MRVEINRIGFRHGSMLEVVTYLSKEDMLAFYADIDIAVSTHRNEGFGIWVLESLAMGTRPGF